MTWSAALNVALGLTLAYLVFSVAVSRINEFVASRLQWRATGLERALNTMLGPGPDAAADVGAGHGIVAAPKRWLLFRDAVAPLTSIGTEKDGEPVNATDGPAAATAVLSAKTVKDHPIVATFEAALGKGRRISYLPSRAFSAAVLDILAPPAVVVVDSIPPGDVPKEAEPALEDLRARPDAGNLSAFEQALPADSPLRDTTLPRLRSAITSDVLEQARATVLALGPDNPARRPLLRMLTDAGNERDVFRAKLEHWYDDEMSRLTGWYKRRVQRFIIGYGVALTLLFNVDTITVSQTLWRSPVVQAAAAQAAGNAAGRTVADVDTSIAAIKGLAMPLGWTAIHDGKKISADPRHFPAPSAGPWAWKVLGLAITIFALAFGAPFWFDVLGKLARLRNAGGVTSTTDDTRRP
jgi:hypothetical protein